jgi:hypothetical protein
LPSAGGETIEARFPQILRRRLHEFRLLRLFLGTSRDGEIGQRIVRLHAAEGGVESRARDAERLGIGPYGLKPAVERRIGFRNVCGPGGNGN